MIGLASAFPSSSFEDPIFIRTHFLGKIASQDLGFDEPSYSRKASTRHSDLGRWDAKWFTTITQHDISSDESDLSDSEETPKPPATSSGSRSDRAKSVSHADSSLPVVVERNMLKPVRARHGRSASAPQPPLLPTQPLTINTSQPLRLSSPSLESLRSLSGSNTMRDLRLKNQVATSSLVIECSESDGSCHGDAGDYDPEGQLAAEIIRMRNANRASVQNENPSSLASSAQIEIDRTPSRTKVKEVQQQIQTETETETETETYNPATEDGSASDDDHSMTINQYRRGFAIRIAEAALDVGVNSLVYLMDSLPVRQEVKPVADDANDRQRAIQRIATTPRGLRDEARQMILRRQSSISLRSRRSNPVFDSPEDRSQSFVSMPGLLSRSNSLWSLASSTIPTIPINDLSSSEKFIRVESDFTDDQMIYPSFGVQHRKYAGYGLSSYADVPSAFMDCTSTEATPMPSSLLTTWWEQASASLRHHRESVAFDDRVSPLWREQDKDEELSSQSFWKTLFKS